MSDGMYWKCEGIKICYRNSEKVKINFNEK